MNKENDWDHIAERIWQRDPLNMFQYSFEKSCLSHKLFVTLSSVAVSRQKGRSRVNKSFM